MPRTALNAKLDSFGDEFIVLLLEDAKNYAKNNITVIKHIVNDRKYSIIYLSMNRPYDAIVDKLKKSKVNTGNIFFIDAISKMIKSNPSKALNCLHISSPSSLTELSIASATAVKNIKKKKKLLYLDSLSTLFMYNKSNTVVRFSHSLISMVRRNGASGILITIKKNTSPKVISQISQFCDAVVTDGAK